MSIEFEEVQEPAYGGGTEPFYRARLTTPHGVVFGGWMRCKPAALKKLVESLAPRHDLALLLGVNID